MIPSVPGITANFDASAFRAAIQFAMQMGTNNDPLRRPRFIRKSSQRTYLKNGVEVPAPRLDRDGRPLDPEVEVVQGQDIEITVNCAVEVERVDANELPVGNLRPIKLTVTILDTEYGDIQGCRELLYNGDRYLFGYEPEAPGLFDAGVYILVYYAKDES